MYLSNRKSLSMRFRRDVKKRILCQRIEETPEIISLIIRDGSKKMVYITTFIYRKRRERSIDAKKFEHVGSFSKHNFWCLNKENSMRKIMTGPV